MTDQRIVSTIFVPQPISNLRGFSDSFEIGCGNGEKVRAAYASDCCDRKAIRPATEDIKSEDVRDLIVTAAESRSSQINRLPGTNVWLTGNGQDTSP